jgi:Protein of unknown function (DUF1674)
MGQRPPHVKPPEHWEPDPLPLFPSGRGPGRGDVPTHREGIQTPPLPNPLPGGEREVEAGGPKGPEPTRYGDWESGGRCWDF